MIAIKSRPSRRLPTPVSSATPVKPPSKAAAYHCHQWVRCHPARQARSPPRPVTPASHRMCHWSFSTGSWGSGFVGSGFLNLDS
ncbi:hypothetical protein M0R45_016703 [Rubus argutus]|uniref:Uncharacterized protein n=1 Tax=Rubus argutus TaxID=59490 RepID=A0AAW1XUB5_RUBAR